MFEGKDSSPFVDLAVTMKYHFPKSGSCTVAFVDSPTGFTWVHSLGFLLKYSRYSDTPVDGLGFHPKVAVPTKLVDCPNADAAQSAAAANKTDIAVFTLVLWFPMLVFPPV